MRRDSELIRELLILIEQHEGESLKFSDAVNRSVIGKHLELMEEAGLINNYSQGGSNSYYRLSADLRNLGHDFLESIKEESKWQSFKRFLEENKVSISSVGLSKLADLAINVFS